MSENTQTSNGNTVEIQEELDGRHINTTDYYFDRIGLPVPIQSDDDESRYDLQTPPSQPLAISDRHRLVFVAHSSGFFVARTKDVMESAKEIKEKRSGRCIQELSLVNVTIGRVHILALSFDSSLLAASVGAHVRFFNVDSLLKKDLNPSFTCSPNESSSVKDIRWRRKLDNSFLLLSNCGKLYNGVTGGALKDVMEDVDAVEWSPKGSYVAVAKKNMLSIFSSKFNERLNISLSCKSWIGDSDEECIVKVDSIRWVRSDYIVLGYSQLTADGNEENYLVQVIRSKEGKITDATSNLVAHSFPDIYAGLVDDIVPFGSGPYLSFSYLEEWGLAIVANKKNTIEHIMLLGRSLELEESDIAVIQIARDKWLPRIELQENGDDNLVLGLCVDRVSLYEKVTVHIGVEPKELSPYCVLVCLTLEGRIVMFHVASATGGTVAPATSDEEEESDAVIHEESDSSVLQKQNQVAMDPHTHSMNLQAKIEPSNESLSKVTSNGLQGASFQSWSNGMPVLPIKSEARSLPIAFSPQLDSSFVLAGHKVDAAGISGHGVGYSVLSKGPSNQTPSASFSGGPAQFGRFKDSTVVGNIESLSSLHGSSVAPQENLMMGQPFSHRHHQSRENSKSLPQSGMPNLESNLGKQFGNIKDMARELDALLEGIEERGGFRDACIVLQKTSVELLEQGIGSLSDNCRMWKNIVDQRLEEIHHLLDKTLQVLARKIYMEGIVKQASDSQYWELWNRLKLGSELESKRRHILELNQDLTNQLIGLERHFNTLELNKFGSNDGTNVGQTDFCHRFGPSRHSQSLYSLHNTMNSQLTAAEQLSDCLSKQMAALSIKLPSAKKQNVKKELFDTIGIPYDASFTSPDGKRVSDSSSLKQHLHSSGSAASREQSGRNQFSSMKSNEPETARRRRRDSLDRSWGSFEPPKTMVKRLILREQKELSTNKPSASAAKLHFSPHWPDDSQYVCPKDRLTTSNFLFPSGDRGMHGSPAAQASETKAPSYGLANKLSEPSRALWSDPILRSNISAMSSNAATSSLHIEGQNYTSDKGGVPVEKTDASSTYFQKSDTGYLCDNKSVMLSETNMHQKPSVSSLAMQLAMQIPQLQQKSSELSNTISKVTVPKSSATVDIKDKLPAFANTSYQSAKSLNFAFSTAPSLATCKGQSGENFSLSPASSVSKPTPSSVKVTSPSTLSMLTPTIEMSSSVISQSRSISTSEISLDPNQKILSQSCVSTLSHAPVSSSSFDFLRGSEMQEPLSGSSSQFLLSTPKISEKPVSSSSALPISLSSISNFPASLSGSSAPKALEMQVSSSTAPSTLSSFMKASGLEVASSTGPVKNSTVESTNKEFQTSLDNSVQQIAANASTKAVRVQPEYCSDDTSFAPYTTMSTGLTSGSQLNSMTTSASSAGESTHPVQQPSAHSPFPALLTTSGTASSGKNESSDVAVIQEDDMEEEAPETIQTTELSLGSLGGFGIGSTPNSSAPKANPFGGPFGTNQPSSPFTMSVPTGELLKPASFSFNTQPAFQQSQSATSNASSGGFGAGSMMQAPTPSGFGQPAQIRPGQQALGSVLGSFGQSRQLGPAIPGKGFASPSGFGAGFGNASASTAGGFAGVSSTVGGFASLAKAGTGFASLASGGGGFGNAASAGGGGFANIASAGGGGFANVPSSGGGFAVATSATGGFAVAAAGGGFGALSGQQGAGGFPAFGSAAGGSGKPPEIFSQMRK